MTCYAYDFFDRQFCYRHQHHSLISTINNFRPEKVQLIIDQLNQGTIESDEGLLQELEVILERYIFEEKYSLLVLQTSINLLFLLFGLLLISILYKRR